MTPRSLFNKARKILTSAKKMDETERIMSNPVMMKRLEESREQISAGKGIRAIMDDVCKP